MVLMSREKWIKFFFLIFDPKFETSGNSNKVVFGIIVRVISFAKLWLTLVSSATDFGVEKEGPFLG